VNLLFTRLLLLFAFISPDDKSRDARPTPAPITKKVVPPAKNTDSGTPASLQKLKAEEDPPVITRKMKRLMAEQAAREEEERIRAEEERLRGRTPLEYAEELNWGDILWYFHELGQEQGVSMRQWKSPQLLEHKEEQQPPPSMEGVGAGRTGGAGGASEGRSGALA
jgi:hypothetical protein